MTIDEMLADLIVRNKDLEEERDAALTRETELRAALAAAQAELQELRTEQLLDFIK